MPATSDKQATLFRIAESIKKGKTKKAYSPAATKIARTLAMPKIKEFTQKVS